MDTTGAYMFGRLQPTVVRDFVHACAIRNEYSALGTLIRRRPAAMTWILSEYKRVLKVGREDRKAAKLVKKAAGL